MNAQHEHERPIGDPPDEDDRDDEDEDDFESDKEPEDEEEDDLQRDDHGPPNPVAVRDRDRHSAPNRRGMETARDCEGIRGDRRGQPLLVGPCRTWNFRWYRVRRRRIR